MYLPPHFKADDPALIRQIIDDHPFALLITPSLDPIATHLPLVRVEDTSKNGTLIGHIAKPNPHGAQFDGTTPAIAVFSGPHAYVSPTWYVSKDMVPTWNYAAIHVHGFPVAVDDVARADWIIDRLVQQFESDATGNWRVAQLSETRRLGQMKGIIAFEMPIARLESKVKMSQNRRAEDAAGVRTVLANSAREDDRATAALMGMLTSNPQA